MPSRRDCSSRVFVYGVDCSLGWWSIGAWRMETGEMVVWSTYSVRMLRACQRSRNEAARLACLKEQEMRGGSIGSSGRRRIGSHTITMKI